MAIPAAASFATESALYFGRLAGSATLSSVIGFMSIGTPSSLAASAAMSAQLVGPVFTQ